jgi:hypothetical protein
MDTLEQISKEYNVNMSGYVVSPGKFESEHWSTVSLYQDMMQGFADETLYDVDGCPIDVFILDDSDHDELNVPAWIYAIALTESDSGFVSAEWLTEREFEELTDELQNMDD